MGNVIAFSGTHGTGKTTTAYAFATHLKMCGKNVCVLDELARECPFPINKEADILAQLWISCAQIKKELELSLIYPWVVTDRTVVDTIAYAKVLGLFGSVECDFAVTYTRNYRKILLMDPTKFDYQIPDGVRDLDQDFRMEIHNTLVGLYDEYEIPYTLVEDIQQIYNMRV